VILDLLFGYAVFIVGALIVLAAGWFINRKF
jgi:hypothetical protein